MSDISNNNRKGSEYIITNLEGKTTERNGFTLCSDETEDTSAPDEINCSISEEGFCSLNDGSKNNPSNCSRIQDYRLNLTSVEGTLLEAVPEDSPFPQMALSEHYSGEKVDEPACNTKEPHMGCVNILQESNANSTNIQEQSELTSSNNHHSEPKKECAAPGSHHIPESNASDISECSIATNATNFSQRDKYLSQIMTKTEALTARQQVALWLTRTSMSDLSSMPSLRNIVYPPSLATKEPPSRSSQSSYCSCYHHAHDKMCHKNSISSNNCNRLSTAMSDCCFDGRATAINQKYSSTSPSKVNSSDEKSPNTSNYTNIKRNHSTKSLMGGFSFGFRGVGSNKTFNEKREKTCEENKSLLPSPIAFRKCETVIALTGTSPGSPLGAETTHEDSGTYPSIATSTLVKHRHHQHSHNRPTSHSCSVNNVRLHCGHGSISPSTTSTPHTSKRSASLSLFKKLSSSKERRDNNR